MLYTEREFEMAKYSKETIVCLINRKDVVLVSNTETAKCKKYSNVEDIRGYMAYLLAENLEKVEKEADDDKKYIFIVNRSLIGIDKPENREIWINTKQTKTGKDLEPDFIENIKVIHSICEKLDDRVSVLSSFSIRPREYEGRRYGSERLQAILAKTWDAMDRICPVQRASAPESFGIE